MQTKWLKKKNWIIFLLSALYLLILAGCMGSAGVEEKSAEPKAKGTFHLVGIGPGDADLLTGRALDVIRNADLVFCGPDEKAKLVPYVDFTHKEVLHEYRHLFRFYGKDCAKTPREEQFRDGMSCEDYHKKQAEFAGLVRRAVAEGKHVAVLSSGDPTVYGPDVWSLRELHDLDPKVVPGVSALNAANAALKVSLGEVIITAPFKREEGKDTIESLAGHGRATMVIFMPRDMKDLFARLAKACKGDTPAAIVCDAGIAGSQKVTASTVAGFAASLPAVDSGRSIVYVGDTLAKALFKSGPASGQAGQGKFYLVGMGPGDADLTTLRAVKVIEKADLIFAGENLKQRYASLLTGKKVLDGYHRLFPFYGKKCSEISEAEKRNERMSCEEYHQKQAEFAAIAREAISKGETVVMLDSGDPLIYSPCSWTLTELKDLNTEVVPGMSCFNAANAALRAGITEGKDSHSVILASGWTVEEMAAHQCAMSLFTMRTEFKKFIDSLSKHYPAETPVAVVLSAGYAEKEKVIHGTLGDITARMAANTLPFEYLLYVGDFLNHSVDRLNN